jgi:carboxylesterase
MRNKSMKNNPIPVFLNPQLPGDSLFWEGSSTGVLLIHGFTATTVEVRLLAEFFHKKGCAVSAPLLPGHGTTPEDLNTRKYQDWIDSVEDSYRKIKQQCSQMIVGGESMGAVLGLYLAETYPEISALLLYSPAIKVSSLNYAGFVKWFKPIIVKDNYDDTMPWQGYTVYPMKAAHEFSKLQCKVIRRLKTVRQPALILQGIYDRTIDPDSCQLIFERIASTKKKKETMQHSGHVMLLDQENDKICRITERFLNNLNIL